MPFGDGTGPMGYGPMSGRGVGYCAGFNMPGFANPMPGRGFGRGRGFGWRRGFRGGFGFGRGFGWGFVPVDPYEAYPYREPVYPQPVAPQTPYGEPVSLSKEEQRKILEDEIVALEEELKAIKRKLNELK